MRRVHSSMWSGGSSATTIVLPPASPAAEGSSRRRRRSSLVILSFQAEASPQPTPQHNNVINSTKQFMLHRAASVTCTSATGWNWLADEGPKSVTFPSSSNDDNLQLACQKLQLLQLQSSSQTKLPFSKSKSCCSCPEKEEEGLESCFTEAAASNQRLKTQKPILLASSSPTSQLRPFKSCTAALTSDPSAPCTPTFANPNHSALREGSAAEDASTAAAGEWLGAALARQSPSPIPSSGGSGRKRSASAVFQHDATAPTHALSEEVVQVPAVKVPATSIATTTAAAGGGIATVGRLRRVPRVLRDMYLLGEE